MAALKPWAQQVSLTVELTITHRDHARGVDVPHTHTSTSCITPRHGSAAVRFEARKLRCCIEHKDFLRAGLSRKLGCSVNKTKIKYDNLLMLIGTV